MTPTTQQVREVRALLGDAGGTIWTDDELVALLNLAAAVDNGDGTYTLDTYGAAADAADAKAATLYAEVDTTTAAGESFSRSQAVAHLRETAGRLRARAMVAGVQVERGEHAETWEWQVL